MVETAGDIQQILAARLAARSALIMAQQARVALDSAPDGLARTPARLVLQAAENASRRATLHLAEVRRRVDTLA